MKKKIKKISNNKKSILRMNNTIKIFLWNIIIFHLIKYILTDQSQNYEDIKNIVYMKVLPIEKHVHIINILSLPDLIYVDGIKTNIDEYGDINFENNSLKNVTMIWNREINYCGHFFFWLQMP